MILKGRLLIIFSAAAFSYVGVIVPAAAENTTAHRESKMLRHPVKHHHRNTTMEPAKR